MYIFELHDRGKTRDSGVADKAAIRWVRAPRRAIARFRHVATSQLMILLGTFTDL